MPQLNPSPWFMIMITSWLILLAMLSPKISAITTQNPPITHNQTPHKTTPWNWPWT